MNLDALFEQHAATFEATRALSPLVETLAGWTVETLGGGGKILMCGNGGSAADCLHLAAEFVGRFLLDRSAWPAIALSTNDATLTAVSNDYGFEHVFARQVQAFGAPGDLLWAYSTSGNSPNVLAAARMAKEKGLRVVTFTAEGGGQLAQLADLSFAVPTPVTARAQEMHLMIGHFVCEIAEEALVSQTKGD